MYLCIDSSLGGSTASLYNLIDSLRGSINPIVLFREKGVGYDYYVSHGIECHTYPFVRLYELRKNNILEVWKHPWRWHYIKKLRFDYGCYKYVKNILAGRNVDIVHTNTSPNDIGVFLARKLHAKHIWHVREFCDLDFHFDIYGGLPRLRQLINGADARIAISTAIRDHWQMKNENTWVVHNAIRKRDDACYIQHKEKYLLLSSYYLTESKGARFAIIAFALSGMKEYGYHLKLMGNCSADYKQILLMTAKEYNVSNAIEFVECQKDVKPYFSHATAYLMASDYEALGRVTAEAMFYGCPVIAHATGGTLDLVKNGETGYLYNTIEECADLIKKVCSENQEYIILNAQQFAINNLSQEVYGPKIMEVYNAVMNKY